MLAFLSHPRYITAVSISATSPSRVPQPHDRALPLSDPKPTNVRPPDVTPASRPRRLDPHHLAPTTLVEQTHRSVTHFPHLLRPPPPQCTASPTLAPLIDTPQRIKTNPGLNSENPTPFDTPSSTRNPACSSTTSHGRMGPNSRQIGHSDAH